MVVFWVGDLALSLLYAFATMKKYIIVALLGITTLANATSYTLFTSLNCYNSSYKCSLPVVNIAPDQEISDCSFTFNSINGGSSSQLYCNLFGGSANCNVGNQTGSTSTWNCNLDTSCVTYLNQCINSGNCGFNLSCYGGYNIGSCQINYTCKPKTQNCPDNSTTAYLLGLGLLGVELARRKLALAR